MFNIYTEKKKASPILTDLRSPIRRFEQHERSSKLKHIEIFTHNAVRRVANLLCTHTFSLSTNSVTRACAAATTINGTLSKKRSAPALNRYHLGCRRHIDLLTSE